MNAATGTLLRIFLSESRRIENRPLYAVVVEELRRQGLHGASVLKGIEGFGMHGRVRTARVIDLAADLPVVIEVIDTRERIEAIIPLLKQRISQGLLTLETVQIFSIDRAAQ